MRRTPLFMLFLAAALGAQAADWTTFNHDNARTAAGDPLRLPMRLAWVHRATRPPEPAWPEPARNDYFHRLLNLTPGVTYDRTFHMTAARGAVFFASSATDEICCLDAATGARRWSFVTEGPVRFAPVLDGEKVLAGSDDGWVYGLSAADGTLAWRYRLGPGDARLPGNGRMISRWPVRTGLVVEDGVAYCAAGLFPVTEGVYLAALGVATGREAWKRKLDLSPQGYLAAAAGKLIVPTGRTPPAAFALRDGQPLGAFGGPGGDLVLIADDVVFTGPGEAGGQLRLCDLKDRKSFCSMDGLRLTVCKDRAYVQSRTDLAALDLAKFFPPARRRGPLEARLKDLDKRKDEKSAAEKAELAKQIADLTAEMRAATLWRVKSADSCALILAGDVLVAGGEGRATVHRASDGQQAWSAPVAGRAYGLAAADGRLFASTDQGVIHAFETGEARPGADEPKSGPVRPFSKPSPYPADDGGSACEHKAEAILKHFGARKGYCLVLDAGDGRLAHEIAKRSELYVIGAVRDAAKAAAARKLLSAAGVYGARLSIHHVEGDALPYPDGVFNLIAADAAGGATAARPEELFRVLKPWGGVRVAGRPEGAGAAEPSALEQWLAGAKEATAGARIEQPEARWTVVRRGPLAGAGEWTHGLADPGNTLCSGDRNVSGRLALQWFGRPGPREMPDRHHRNVPPLCRDGRLFIPGDELVLAVDAFNGTELWRREFPDSRRLGAFLDCGSAAADDRALYFVVQDACHVLDPATGATLRKLGLPPPVAGRAWGYVAAVEGLVVGSACQPAARYVEQSYKADTILWGDRMPMVTSDALFALDRADGSARWTHTSGVIVNATITIGGGRVYFIETRNPKALAQASGRTPMETILEGPNFLVALDLKTGQPAWRRELDLANCRHIAYLSYSAEMLVLTGNRYLEKKLWYFFTGMDAATGKTVWERSHNAGYAPGGEHGEQNRHPVIAGATVYTDPLAYDLKTGQPLEGWKWSRHGHGCGGLSASAGALFWRGENPWRWDLRPGAQPARVNSETRPGCWINMVPACGLLLIPEASSGCTCAYPIQTSLAYRPVRGE